MFFATNRCKSYCVGIFPSKFFIKAILLLSFIYTCMIPHRITVVTSTIAEKSKRLSTLLVRVLCFLITFSWVSILSLSFAIQVIRSLINI